MSSRASTTRGAAVTGAGASGHGSAEMAAAATVTTPELDRELTELFRAHGEFVWRVLRRLGLDDEAAEDGVQEVFCVVHRRIGEFDASRGSARSWLYAIARRVASHAHRSRTRRERWVQQLPEPEEGGTPEERAQVRQRAQLAARALERMDEPHRTVFVLARVEGMAAPEIAAALGIPLNTVYSRIRNGRKKFARMVDELERAGRGGHHEP